MGQEFWILPTKKDSKHVRKLVAQIGSTPSDKGNYRYVEGPSIDKYKLDCWIHWRGPRLEIGYAAGAYLGEWAKAIALEICKRFRPKRAGHDAIGYIKDLDQFITTRPFDVEMRLRMDAMKRSSASEELKRKWEKEIQDMKQYQKIVTEGAAVAFKDL